MLMTSYRFDPRSRRYDTFLAIPVFREMYRIVAIADRLTARADWGMNVVNEEDTSLCENVQLGMQQRGFTQ